MSDMQDVAEAPPSLSEVSGVSDSVLELTTEIVSAHLSNNSVPIADVSGLIRQVYETLSTIDSQNKRSSDQPIPVVPIKKSITDEYIICLEDGKKLKMLKRYLKTTYGMSPDQYRVRWGLGRDYPMVAPGYARERSELAKRIGLGRKSRSPAPLAD